MVKSKKLKSFKVVIAKIHYVEFPTIKAIDDGEAFEKAFEMIDDELAPYEQECELLMDAKTLKTILKKYGD